MELLIGPMFCVSVGFVVFLGASGVISYLLGRNSRGSHSSRRERKAAMVIGVAAGLVLALNMLGGAAHRLGVWMGGDLLMLLITVCWVWRILTSDAAKR
jgi:hypothetical protein